MGYKERLIHISKILGYEIDFNDSDTDELVEQKFISWVGNRCGCTLDWRPNLEDLKESLREFATDKEIEIIQAIPGKSWSSNQEIVASIKDNMKDKSIERMPVLLESLGDFCHFLLVPKEKLAIIERVAGGWLIDT